MSADGLAQPRASVTPQEAQTPPRIDQDQLRTQPQSLDAGKGDIEAALLQLQTTAHALLAKGDDSQAKVIAQREALWQWGLLQLHGLHTSMQPAQAVQSFEQAYRLGYPLAAAGLAWCAIDGCGQRPQPEAALEWITTLHKIAPGRAAYLAWLMQDDATPIDQAVPSTAPRQTAHIATRKQQLLQQAVTAGDPQAKVEWGMELAALGKTDAAIAQFRFAAQESDAAKHNLDILSEQKGTFKPRPSGNPGQAGGAWQTFKQARAYHRGEGIPANYTEAIRLYKRASDMGSAPAKRMLALIYSRPSSGGGIDIAWMQQLAYMDVSKDGAVPLTAPTTPASLTRDPTPLYDYIAKKWRLAF